jgi:hypothetical protein
MYHGRTALYRLFDGEHQLLYVGIGETAASRWRDHRANKPWWDDVVRAEVVWYPTRGEAEAEELRVIKTERPLYNVMGTFDRLKRPTKSTPLSSGVVYVDDIAGFLDLSVSYVRQQIARRADFPPPCERRANRWVWRADEVEAWAEVHRSSVTALAAS